MFYLAMQPAGSQGGRKDAGLDSMLDPLRLEPSCAAFHPSGITVCIFWLKRKACSQNFLVASKHEEHQFAFALSNMFI